MDVIESFPWSFGTKFIHRRIHRGGLLNAISESWHPASNHNYAIILEDDIEVSSQFYVWARSCLLKYRYDAASPNHEHLKFSDYEKNRRTRLFGISLYTPRLQEMTYPRKRFSTNALFHPPDWLPHTPFLYQLPCSWGALYFPEHWKEFQIYLIQRLQELEKSGENNSRAVFVPHARSNTWDRSWKRYGGGVYLF